MFAWNENFLRLCLFNVVLPYNALLRLVSSPPCLTRSFDLQCTSKSALALSLEVSSHRQNNIVHYLPPAFRQVWRALWHLSLLSANDARVIYCYAAWKRCLYFGAAGLLGLNCPRFYILTPAPIFLFPLSKRSGSGPPQTLLDWFRATHSRLTFISFFI